VRAVRIAPTLTQHKLSLRADAFKGGDGVIRIGKLA
jgi:hypothetical protein